MVVLLDLDDDPFLDPHRADPRTSGDASQPWVGGTFSADARRDLEAPQTLEQPPEDCETERPNPNLNGFSAILNCYPIVSSLASLLDLNTLHALSRTCRQFRANLLDYRNQLVTRTLRCSNEEEPLANKLASGLAGIRASWNGGSQRMGERITSGKIGKCARDMVGNCRKCGIVVCRNCTSKPPPPVALPGRVRRLCKTCANAPLSLLTSPSITSPAPICDSIASRSRHPAASPGTSPKSSTSSLSSTPPTSGFPNYTPGSTSSSPSSSPLKSSPLRTSVPNEASGAAHSAESERSLAFTAPAFLRTPCNCPNEVYLCGPCGHTLRTADQTYMLGWTWRSRYSTYLDGLGTGIGEGHEGVKCGLGSSCRGGREVECEECGTVEEVAALSGTRTGTSPPTNGGSSAMAGSPRDEWSGTSYLAQEIEGIGGRRVMKLKKRVKVGAVVKEYEDERESGVYLRREREGTNRAWCAWCARVVPSSRDWETWRAMGFEQ
ncbi:uncharacterized protein K452DRAFT_338660 [Aplosporella prunicola CBS 121167]|uniref:F-box domain-containing protein n=1 Tax=Aplosporella prunicola CBS 121167 TaxID=1176127 RepID=A0A6A6B2Z6_9PEZI|nr:uncharacterized protein K452DRAFT_338660 [Aplosporella prunicola CBS 121167]KAF2138559.1 hypothetical protein K452DRAFT_338660 [Aplosporella prunicola CBS 121167]